MSEFKSNTLYIVSSKDEQNTLVSLGLAVELCIVVRGPVFTAKFDKENTLDKATTDSLKPTASDDVLSRIRDFEISDMRVCAEATKTGLRYMASLAVLLSRLFSRNTVLSNPNLFLRYKHISDLRDDELLAEQTRFSIGGAEELLTQGINDNRMYLLACHYNKKVLRPFTKKVLGRKRTKLSMSHVIMLHRICKQQHQGYTLQTVNGYYVHAFPAVRYRSSEDKKSATSGVSIKNTTFPVGDSMLPSGTPLPDLFGGALDPVELYTMMTLEGVSFKNVEKNIHTGNVGIGFHPNSHVSKTLQEAGIAGFQYTQGSYPERLPYAHQSSDALVGSGDGNVAFAYDMIYRNMLLACSVAHVHRPLLVESDGTHHRILDKSVDDCYDVFSLLGVGLEKYDSQNQQQRQKPTDAPAGLVRLQHRLTPNVEFLSELTERSLYTLRQLINMKFVCVSGTCITPTPLGVGFWYALRALHARDAEDEDTTNMFDYFDMLHVIHDEFAHANLVESMLLLCEEAKQKLKTYEKPTWSRKKPGRKKPIKHELKLDTKTGKAYFESSTGKKYPVWYISGLGKLVGFRKSKYIPTEQVTPCLNCGHGIAHLKSKETFVQATCPLCNNSTQAEVQIIP
jgi:hypothetical protein